MPLARSTAALAALVALTLSGTACTSEPSTPPSPPTYTAVLSVAPGIGSTRVAYTCGAPDGTATTCTDQHTRADGVWEKEVTVPVGTVIRVQVSGGDTTLSSCTILDSTKSLKLASSSGPASACTAEAR